MGFTKTQISAIAKEYEGFLKLEKGNVQNARKRTLQRFSDTRNLNKGETRELWIEVAKYLKEKESPNEQKAEPARIKNFPNIEMGLPKETAETEKELPPKTDPNSMFGKIR